jgi:hypothetical protein
VPAARNGDGSSVVTRRPAKASCTWHMVAVSFTLTHVMRQSQHQHDVCWCGRWRHPTRRAPRPPPRPTCPTGPATDLPPSMASALALRVPSVLATVAVVRTVQRGTPLAPDANGRSCVLPSLFLLGFVSSREMHSCVPYRARAHLRLPGGCPAIIRRWKYRYPNFFLCKLI